MKETQILLTTLIGKTLEEATKLCKHNGYAIRLVSKDDASFIVTRDYKLNRVNVSLTKDLITKADIG